MYIKSGINHFKIKNIPSIPVVTVPVLSIFIPFVNRAPGISFI